MWRGWAQVPELSKAKIEGVSESRCPLAPTDEKSPLFCSACGVSEVQFVCTGCRCVQYCGKECQKSDWNTHRVLCNTISDLARERDEKIDEMCSFISHVTPKVRRKLVELVGERCLINCMLQNQEVEGLWDTGAQVSLVCQQWLSSLNDPPEIKSLESLVGPKGVVQLSGAGGKNIPYLGYVTLPVLLKGQNEALDV